MEVFDKLLYEAHIIGTPGIGFGPSGEGYMRFTGLAKRRLQGSNISPPSMFITKKDNIQEKQHKIILGIMSKLRFRVVEKAFHKKPIEVTPPSERPSEYFAKYVFNREKMFKYLPSKVYAKLIDVIDNGAALDRSIADEVAAGMKNGQ